MQRFGVEQAVEAMGPRARELAPDVLDALNSSDTNVRRRGPRMAAAIGPAATLSVPRLIELLDDSEEIVTHQAARALMHFGPLASLAIERFEAEVAKNPEAFGGYAKAALRVIRDHEPIPPPDRFPWEN
jgi:hypothetical protein